MRPRLHKLVWKEGMHLAPQHFQSQARFFENSVAFLSECFWPYSFGFTNIEIDQAELRSGSFRLHHLSGFMPDGMAFDLTRNEDLPPVLAFADLFPDSGQPLLLYLCVDSYRQNKPCLAHGNPGDSGRRFRFQPSSLEVPDANTGQDVRSVKVMRPDLRVAAPRERTETDVSMPLARIRREGANAYVLDPSFAPPCLRVSASPRLQNLLERLLGILTEKSRNLTALRRDAAASQLRGNERELVEFWLLHTVNASLPVLRMWKAGRSPHPAQLYRDMSRLAGALCTFASDSTPMCLPEYDHEALGECFGAVDEHIRRHLELTLPTDCFSIPLQAFDPGGGQTPGSGGEMFLKGAVPDELCMARARWVMSVCGSASEATIINRIPDVVKISSWELIPRIVARNLPGVPFSYLPVPPPSLPPARAGEVYFGIDTGHKFFEAVRNFRSVGFSIPSLIPNAELKLYVILDKPE